MDSLFHCGFLSPKFYLLHKIQIQRFNTQYFYITIISHLMYTSYSLILALYLVLIEKNLRSIFYHLYIVVIYTTCLYPLYLMYTLYLSIFVIINKFMFAHIQCIERPWMISCSCPRYLEIL